MSWTLVTGGAKGVGAAICLELARERKNVVIHYRKSEKEALLLQERCEALGGKAQLFQADLREFDLERYCSLFGDTEAIVHNVGNYDATPLLEMPVSTWKELFQVNLHAPFEITKGLLPSLKAHKGAVVHLGVSGLERKLSHSSAYRMTKMGLLMLTESLASELARFEVRVNMVSPGQLENSVNAPDPATLPMKRLGKPEEVKDAVVFLLGSSITGQNIEVGGGYQL